MSQTHALDDSTVIPKINNTRHHYTQSQPIERGSLTTGHSPIYFHKTPITSASIREQIIQNYKIFGASTPEVKSQDGSDTHLSDLELKLDEAKERFDMMIADDVISTDHTDRKTDIRCVFSFFHLFIGFTVIIFCLAKIWTSELDCIGDNTVYFALLGLLIGLYIPTPLAR